MRGPLPLPLWAAALILAAVAPFVARALAILFSRQARERSRRVLESPRAPATIDGTPRTD